MGVAGDANDLLREARRRSGLTQEQTAEAIGGLLGRVVEPEYIGRLERGAVHWPGKAVRSAFRQHFNVGSDSDLGFYSTKLHNPPPGGSSVAVSAAEQHDSRILLSVVINGRRMLIPVEGAFADQVGTDRQHENEQLPGPRVPAAWSATDWDDMGSVSRRSALLGTLGVVAAPLLDTAGTTPASLAVQHGRRQFHDDAVGRFRRQLNACKSDDGQRRPEETLPVVLDMLSTIDYFAADLDFGVRRRLLGFGAECAEFAGWLFRDARHISKAVFWHDRAIEWAQEAGDAPMQGYVLLKKSQLAYDQREPAKMLSLARAAQDKMYQIPGRVRAEAIQQEARAEAMLGHPVAGIERKLDLARAAVSDAVDDEHALGAHYTEKLLSMQTAVCYAEAGQPKRAVDVYTSELVSDGFSPRDYGFFMSWMAGALALSGEPDQAAQVGAESARRAAETHSQRTRQELVRVVHTLDRWRHRPSVRGLRESVLA